MNGSNSNGALGIVSDVDFPQSRRELLLTKGGLFSSVLARISAVMIVAAVFFVAPTPVPMLLPALSTDESKGQFRPPWIWSLSFTDDAVGSAGIDPHRRERRTQPHVGDVLACEVQDNKFFVRKEPSGGGARDDVVRSCMSSVVKNHLRPFVVSLRVL